MGRTPIIAIAVLIASGCRSADTLYEAQSATHRYSSSTPLADNHSESARDSAGSLAPAPVTMQPVTYQQQPRGREPGAASEPLSVRPMEPLSQSDLTLLDLEGIALQSSPVLAQMVALIDAAQGNWAQVGLPPNPTAGYAGQQLGSRGLAEQQGVYLGQQLITGKKLRLNRQVAAWEIERAQEEMEAMRLKVLTDVRIAFYDVLIAQHRRDLAEELVHISEKAVAAAEALFRSEEVSLADPLRARVEADSARILLQTATNQHREAWRVLTAVVAMPDLVMVRIHGELDPAQLDISWHETLQQILVESPEMAAAIADVEATRWAIDRAHAEVIPDIDVQAVIQDDRGTGSTNGNLQVSVPLPIINRNQGGIQQAHAEAAAAEQAVDRLALDLQRRLAEVFQRYESARNQVQQYSRSGGILENSERTQELLRAGYEAEEFGVLDLLTAQRTYFRTNLAYLDALRELWASTMEIHGLLLKSSLPR